MTDSSLPASRVMSRAYKERGRDDVAKIDVLNVVDGELLKITFESTASSWRQGIWLRTDKGVIINSETCQSARLWFDTAPKTTFARCQSTDGRLHVYNIWDRGNGPESQAWSSGMVIEDLPFGRRYRCNDIGFETDFSKIVFCIERVALVDSE